MSNAPRIIGKSESLPMMTATFGMFSSPPFRNVHDAAARRRQQLMNDPFFTF
jgi:hypothetical protein